MPRSLLDGSFATADAAGAGSAEGGSAAAPALLSLGFAFFGAAAGFGVGYWYLNEKRETIFVKDVLHGRHFSCDSVVELARKEAWLEGACGVFRQVMESAKHWEGVERHTIKALPKEQAKELILRAA